MLSRLSRPGWKPTGSVRQADHSSLSSHRAISRDLLPTHSITSFRSWFASSPLPVRLTGSGADCDRTDRRSDMTQTQLDHRSPGSPVSPSPNPSPGLQSRTRSSRRPRAGTVQLVLDCPFCGCPVPYPGLASDGSETMAECDRCDVYFGFDPEEIYVLESDDRSGRRDRIGRQVPVDTGPTEEPGHREN